MKKTILFIALALSAFAQPAPFQAKIGQEVSLTATADGDKPFVYQWRKGGNAITGATVNPLILTIKSAADAGNYDVIVSNSAGSATSPAGAIVVAAPIAAPIIMSQPVSATVRLGGNNSFTVSVIGTGPFTYQWKKNGAIIPPSTGPSLFINGATLADIASYTCTITNSAGSVTSVAATLAVTIPAAPPSNLNITISLKQ